MEANRFDGRVALVTGAARGTGEAIARCLSSQGAHVVVTDVLATEGRAVAESVGGRFEVLDVTSEDDWSRVASEVHEALGRIDVLVNNAAVLHLGAIERTPPETFRRLLDVNTVGPFLGIQAVAPFMRQAARGAIVNVASSDALTGMNGATAYCASKWGLRGLARAAAMELGRDGIRVNTVCPAGGNPQMFGPWLERMVPFMQETLDYTEQRAIPGEAPVEVIAEAVAWLASDESRHCTGVDLPVDGGATAGTWIAGFNTL